MKKISLCVIAFVALSLSLVNAQETDAAKKDVAQLQGEWTMVSGSADGAPLPEEMVKNSKRICKSNETTTIIGGNPFMKAKFTLDPSKKPKTIDYEMIEGFTKGKKQLGIYEIDGDTFKSCFSGPGDERPTDFTSKPGDRRTCSVWKRKKETASEAEKK